jgi:hypothetical protein
MIEMMDAAKQAPKKIKCMIYKQQFKSRLTDLKQRVSKCVVM